MAELSQDHIRGRREEAQMYQRKVRSPWKRLTVGAPMLYQGWVLSSQLWRKARKAEETERPFIFC